MSSEERAAISLRPKDNTKKIQACADQLLADTLACGNVYTDRSSQDYLDCIEAAEAAHRSCLLRAFGAAPAGQVMARTTE